MTAIPVFWGASVAADTQANMLAVLGVIDGSGWSRELLREYGNTFEAERTITIAPHLKYDTTITDTQIQSELNWQMDHNALPSDADYAFLVHFPPTLMPLAGGYGGCVINPGGNYWCAYHGQLAARHAGYRLTYAVIPDHSQGACAVNWCATGAPDSFAAMTVAESHELAEIVTDPDNSTGFKDRYPNNPCHGSEIADICQNEAISITNSAGTAWVQTIWSNRANACVSSPGATSDMNSDGRSDLVLTGGGSGGPWSTMPVAFSSGSGTYTGTNAGEVSGDTGFSHYATQTGAKPVAGDFDGDGLSDLALVGGVGWNTIPVAFQGGGTYRGTNKGLTSGDAHFFTYASAPSPNNGTIPVSGDFNGDGRTDIALIVTGSNSGAIPIALSNGDGTFAVVFQKVTTGDTNFTLYAAQNGARPVAGDFNGDGLADIALVGGAGWTTMPVAFSVLGATEGSNTFFGTNRGVVAGDGTFVSQAVQGGAKFVAGDFNGDGLSDIALVNGTARLATMPVVFSNGDGTYWGSNGGETSGDLSFFAYAQIANARPVAGDFDGDGLADIALVGGLGMATMPIAFSNLQPAGTYHGTNGGEVAGDLGFAGYAQQTGARPVSW